MTALLLALSLCADNAPRTVKEAPSTKPQDFDFDFLGSAPAKNSPPPIDLETLKTRRLMLQIHQAAGLTLVAMMLTTVILGQLNYVDRFMTGDSTGRYELAHAVAAYTTFGFFVGTGALALFAPKPLVTQSSDGVDRVTLHRIGLFGAAAGMIAQIVLGIVTRQQEGFIAQGNLAVAHLAVGYATLGLMAFGVGALVF
jgi:hypothetical protein